MDYTSVAVEHFQLFLICFARVASLFAAIPVMGTGVTPVRIKVGLAAFFTLAIFPITAPMLPSIEFSIIPLALLLTKEALLGLAIGLVPKLMFAGIEFGGSIIGYQMGFSAANVMDPQNQAQVPLISQFYSTLTFLLFLAMNAHHVFLQLIVESYKIIPVGEAFFGRQEAASFLIAKSTALFVIGVKFCAPILVVLLMAALVLGILARVFPQLNVFILSFPINIGAALAIMGASLYIASTLIKKQFFLLENDLLLFMHTLFS